MRGSSEYHTGRISMQSKVFLFALAASFFWGLAPIFGKIGLVKVDRKEVNLRTNKGL